MLQVINLDGQFSIIIMRVTYRSVFHDDDDNNILINENEEIISQ